MAIAQFPALGSTAVVQTTDAALLDDARAVVQSTVDAFDRTCSRFREDSELALLNARSGGPVALSPLLLEALSAALFAAQATDGDVDPTVGSALIALGYDRDFDAISSAPRITLAPVAGWRTVKLDRGACTVTVPRGVKLDLGASAKALAADHAARAASAATGCGVLVSLGGDIAMVGEAPDGGWLIHVTDDHRAGVDAPGQSLSLRSGGLATSSTTVRRWQTESGGVHHLIDPATGAPAVPVWRTVSVTAATCLEANLASTAAIIRGERAVGWLAELGLPSRLVAADGSAVHVAGWPQEGDELT